MNFTPAGRKQMLEKTDIGAGIPEVNPKSTICHDLNLSKLSNFTVLHLYSGYIKGHNDIIDNSNQPS